MEDFDKQRAQFSGSLHSIAEQWDNLSNYCRSILTEVESLRNENGNLRKEVESLKVKPEPATRAERTKNTARQYSNDSLETSQAYELLMHDNHTKQAQIEVLEAQLRKERARLQKWRSRHPLSSSPVVSSSPISSSKSDGLVQPACPSKLGLGERSLVPTKQTFSVAEDVQNHATSTVIVEEVPKDHSLHPKKVLRETSGNKPKKPRNFDERGIKAIPAVAEDGETYGRKLHSEAKLNMEDDKSGKILASKRLASLLKEPTPKRSTLNAPCFIPTTSNSVDLGLPPAKKLKFLSSNKRISSGPEDAEPLRSRPLQRLSLNHFKLNPAANSGLDYAFQEVVRGHEQRKCLPGCTRSECCGDQFRALVRALPRGSEDPESEEWQADDEILLNFIGPGSEEKIRTLTSLARRNLLEEAKIKILADKYGKLHRHAHDRAASPPGFWNTDVSGTQEEREIYEQAREREREEVEKRFLEACRNGGKWIFADE